MPQNNFSEEVRELALESTFGFCKIRGCNQRATELHHILPNTIPNNKKFPLFTQSLWNCFPICPDCHMHYSSFPELKITEKQADAYEKYLKSLLQNK